MTVRKLMKTLSVLVFLASSISIHPKALPFEASDFYIVQRANNKFYLLKKRKESINLAKVSENRVQIFELNVTGKKASVLLVREIPEHDGLYCIVYSAGESGTSTIIQENRCALYNNNVRRFEGDLPFEYIVKKTKSKKGYPQPVYFIEKGELKVKEDGLITKKLRISVE